MSKPFNPSPSVSAAFKLVTANSIGERLTIQSELQSGWHSSRSDANNHLTIKNANGKTTGHYYENGMIKDFNGSLNWLK